MVVPADSIKEVLTWICGRPSHTYITGVGAGCTIRFICLCSTWWWTFLRWLALGWFAAAYTNRIILYISDLQYSLARDYEPYCIPILRLHGTYNVGNHVSSCTAFLVLA